MQLDVERRHLDHRQLSPAAPRVAPARRPTLARFAGGVSYAGRSGTLPVAIARRRAVVR